MRVTFFFVGRLVLRAWLERPHETRRLLRRIMSDGHTIGFHSMDHLTEPAEHMQAWRPDQVVDSVRLFRRVLDLAVGRAVPVRYGRTPGGTGSDTSRLRLAFARSRLAAPVHWTVGPWRWTPGAEDEELTDLARRIRARGGQIIVLLHEHPQLGNELRTFLSALRDTDPNLSLRP